jgi:hypothetical protein
VSPLVNAETASQTSFGQLQLADPFSSDWDSGLAQYEAASIFHTTAWARVLQESYSYKPYYFRWKSGGSAKPVCFFEINSWLTGRRAVSLPFADEVAPLGINSSEELKGVITAVAAVGRSKGWKRIEMRGVPADWEDATSNRYFSHELDLSSPSEELYKNCNDSTRRAVRKAERSGMEIEIRNDLEAIEEYFKLHCLTRKKHGVPPQPLYFFKNLQRHIIAGGQGFTALARLNGQALAGAVFFIFRGNAIYKFGASDPAADMNRPSNLVMWSGIKEAARRGAKSLSFGRTDLAHDGLRRYKLGWGAKEKTISYLQFKLSSETFSSGTGSGQNSFIFRILPSWIQKQVGAALYPHLG